MKDIPYVRLWEPKERVRVRAGAYSGHKARVIRLTDTGRVLCVVSGSRSPMHFWPDELEPR